MASCEELNVSGKSSHVDFHGCRGVEVSERAELDLTFHAIPSSKLEVMCRDKKIYERLRVVQGPSLAGV